MNVSFEGLMKSYLGKFSAVLVIVFIFVKAGLLLIEQPYFTVIVWPAFGIASGILILYGLRFLPAVIIAMFAGFYFHDYTSLELLLSPLKIALILTIIGGLLVIVKKTFIKSAINKLHFITRPIQLMKLFIVLTAVSASLIAILYLVMFTTDLLNSELSRYIWISWIGADLAGSVIFIPVVLSFHKNVIDDYSGRSLERLMLYALLITLISGVLLVNREMSERFTYLVIPVIFWVAFRFSIKDIAVGLIALAFISSYSFIQPDYSMISTHYDLLLFSQLLIFVSSVIFYTINRYSFLLIGEGGRSENYFLAGQSKRSGNANQLSIQKEIQLLQTAIKQSPGSIIITNQHGEIEYANPAFSKITGYKLKDVLGKNPRILKSGHHPDSFYKELWDSILRGETWTGQFYNKRKDGKLYWEEATIAPIYIKGEILHFICTKEDITERMNAEATIKESEKKFRSFFEDSNVYILLIDPESGKIVDANNAALDYYGYKKEELQNLSFLDLSVLENRNSDTKLDQILDFNKRMIPFRQKMKNGRIKDTEVYPTPVNIENKKLLFTVIQDVTRRKKAIAALTESESKKLALLKIIPDLIFVVNREGVIIDLYIEKLSSLVMPPSEMLGKRITDILPRDEAKKFRDNFQTTFDTRDIITFDYSYKHKGKEVFEEIRLIVSGEDELLVIIRDITNQKKSEKDLKEAWQEAKKANAAKSAFIANVSHEIRTPINAIIGFSELLAKEIDQGHLQDYISSIKSSSKTLLSLIEDILDFSKIEAGKLDVKHEFINLHSILDDTRNIFWLKMQQKKLNFTTEISKSTPELLLLDALKIRQILINLVSNAYKFTEGGEVNLSINSANKRRANKKIYVDIVISVSDTGIGIPKEFQETIFQAFKQQEEQDSRKYGGTGLGLAITYRLVELMKGSIKLESEPDKGSTFEIYIPNVETGLSPEPKPPRKSRHYIRFHDSNILVVDDVVSNRELLKGAIKGENIAFFEAGDGQQAINILKKEVPDIVLLDLNLPEISGFEVARYMKKSSRLKNIPIIGISAIHVVDKSDDVGKNFDVFLSKPFDVNVLLEHVKKYLPHRVKKSAKTEKSDLQSEEKDISFSTDNIDSLQNGISKMRNEFFSIIDTSSFMEIKDYANRLKELALKNNIIALEKIADKIIAASDNFDIDEMNKFMVKVPSLLKKINERI